MEFILGMCAVIALITGRPGWAFVFLLIGVNS